MLRRNGEGGGYYHHYYHHYHPNHHHHHHPPPSPSSSPTIIIIIPHHHHHHHRRYGLKVVGVPYLGFCLSLFPLGFAMFSFFICQCLLFLLLAIGCPSSLSSVFLVSLLVSVVCSWFVRCPSRFFLSWAPSGIFAHTSPPLRLLHVPDGPYPHPPFSCATPLVHPLHYLPTIPLP